MALIPLKQAVTIRRHGEPDEWGRSTSTEFTLKCRFVETVKLTRKTGVTENINGIDTEEIVSSGQFTFDKFTEILMTDEFIFVDEAGKQSIFKPLNIERVRGVNGKAMLTVVTV